MRILLALIIFLSINASASIQIPDTIYFNNKAYPNNSVYFLREYFDKYPEKMPDPIVFSTNLYRGYVASVEIRKGKLYLKSMYMDIDYNRDVYGDVAGDLYGLEIDWFDGMIILPTGRRYTDTLKGIFLNDHYSLHTREYYSRYAILLFKEGKLTHGVEVNSVVYDQYMDAYFEEYKRKDDYEELLVNTLYPVYINSQHFEKDFKKWKYTPEGINAASEINNKDRREYFKKRVFFETDLIQARFNRWKATPEISKQAEASIRYFYFPLFNPEIVTTDPDIIRYFIQ